MRLDFQNLDFKTIERELKKADRYWPFAKKATEAAEGAFGSFYVNPAFGRNLVGSKLLDTTSLVSKRLEGLGGLKAAGSKFVRAKPLAASGALGEIALPDSAFSKYAGGADLATNKWVSAPRASVVGSAWMTVAQQIGSSWEQDVARWTAPSDLLVGTRLQGIADAASLTSNIGLASSLAGLDSQNRQNLLGATALASSPGLVSAMEQLRRNELPWRNMRASLVEAYDLKNFGTLLFKAPPVPIPIRPERFWFESAPPKRAPSESELLTPAPQTPTESDTPVPSVALTKEELDEIMSGAIEQSKPPFRIRLIDGLLIAVIVEGILCIVRVSF